MSVESEKEEGVLGTVVTFHFTAQKLHPQPEPTVCGSLRVDPDEPCGERRKRPELRSVIVVVTFE